MIARQTSSVLLCVAGVTLVLALAAPSACAAAYNWTPTAAGPFHWNNAGGQDNWGTGAGGAFPNAATDIANLSVNLVADQTVHLNQTVTIGGLTLNDTGTAPDNNVLIAANGGSFIFDNGASNVTLTNTSSASTASGNTIAANIQLNSNLYILNAMTARLTLAGNISQSGGARSVTIDSATPWQFSGPVVLSGVNTYTGQTTVGTNSWPALILDGATLASDLYFYSGTLELTGDSAVGRVNGLTNRDNQFVPVNLNEHTLTVTNTVVGSYFNTPRFEGPISGTGGLTKLGAGNLTLTNANTYSGQTRIVDGALMLTGTNGSAANSSGFVIVNGTLRLYDYSYLAWGNQPNPNRVGDSAGLDLASGTFVYLGQNPGVASPNGHISTETLGGLTIRRGLSQVTVTSNGGTANIIFSGGLSRPEAGGMVNFTLPAAGSLQINNVTLANGIIGGYATVGSDWARIVDPGTNNAVAAFAAYSNELNPNAWTGTDNVKITGTPTANLTANNAVNTLNISGARTLTLDAGTTLTVNAGGIIAAGGNSAINGGTLRSGLPAVAGNDLVAIIESARTLTVNSVIGEGTTPGTGLTKAGAGTLVSTADNTYTGPTTVGGGTLVLSGTSAYTGSTQVNGFLTTLRADDGVGLPAASFLDLRGGILETSGTFSRTLGNGTPGTLRLPGGGFSARGGNLIVDLNGGGADNLLWGGTPNFLDAGQPLIFNPTTSATGRVTFVDNIDLNGREATVAVGTQSAELAGIFGNGSLLVSGATAYGGSQSALVILSGQNTYTGTTTIGGVDTDTSMTLRAQEGVGLPLASNLVIRAGVFESSGTFTRALGTGPGEVRYTRAGGFSAYGGTLTVNLFGDGRQLVWGNTTHFLTGNDTWRNFQLNNATADSVVVFENDLQLNVTTGAHRIVVTDNPAVTTDWAVISGVLSSGPATPTNGLLKIGTGKLVLTGMNTYTGSTVVSDGTLEFTSIADVGGGPSALGAPTTVAAGTITVGGKTLRYSGTGHSSDRVVSITAWGKLDASGSGRLTLTSPLTIPANAELFLDGTGEGELAGSITAAGIKPLKQGTGTWILSGANTYTGITSILGGALRADDGVGLPTASLLQLQGGVLETSGSFTRALTTGTSGNFVKWANNAAGGFAAVGGPLNVNLGGAGAQVSWSLNGFAGTFGNSLIFGSASADNVVEFANPIDIPSSLTANIRVDDNPDSDADRAVLSGVISSPYGGIRKTGGGTLVLTAPNTYPAGTALDAGTLLVNNSSGSGTGTGTVTVSAAAATLGGTGTIGGVVNNNGGTISPGASAGKLTVGGNLTNTSASFMLFEIGGTQQGVDYDWLAVGGTATLGGATLAVSLIDGHLPKFSDSATIITAGLVSGTFDPATTLLPADVLNAVTVTHNLDSVVLSEFDLFPIADLVISNLGGGLYEFDATGSYDPDDNVWTYLDLTKFEWDLGTGTLVEGGSVETASFIGGVHIIRLQVTDNEGTTALYTTTLSIPEPGAFGLLSLAMALLGLRRRRA